MSLETLIQEVSVLCAAMEKQGELLLLLVKLWQGSPGTEPGEILENGPESEMYGENSILNSICPQNKNTRD